MDYYKIPVSNLLTLFPQAECCDCGRNPEDDAENTPWVIYHESIIYCPKCAKYENIYD